VEGDVCPILVGVAAAANGVLCLAYVVEPRLLRAPIGLEPRGSGNGA